MHLFALASLALRAPVTPRAPTALRPPVALRALAPTAMSLSTFKPPLLVEPPHPATLPPEEVRRDCQVSHTKGSGPGGQHRNKVATAVLLKHGPTGLTGSASESRSQQTNLAAALFRLRLRFALEQRCAADPEAAPSALWRGRCKGGKLRVNEAHADFPSLLAEALDRIWQAQEVKAAAEQLGVSSSQLIRFLKQEPRAIQFVNALRASQGLSPLN